VRENIEVIYRINPTEMTGRSTVNRAEMRASIVPKRKDRDPDIL
jgi:hypothetical protein